jgi:hypothetical protein
LEQVDKRPLPLLAPLKLPGRLVPTLAATRSSSCRLREKPRYYLGNLEGKNDEKLIRKRNFADFKKIIIGQKREYKMKLM